VMTIAHLAERPGELKMEASEFAPL
jgi:hypothetical protein